MAKKEETSLVMRECAAVSKLNFKVCGTCIRLRVCMALDESDERKSGQVCEKSLIDSEIKIDSVGFELNFFPMSV